MSTATKRKIICKYYYKIMKADSLEETLILEKIEDRRRRMVRVMEETPNILRVPSQVGKKAGKMWSAGLQHRDSAVGLSPPAPEAEDSLCPRAGHSLPSSFQVIWQESLPPMEARSMTTTDLFTVHSQGFIFKCHCAFNHIVNILWPDRRHGHKIWSWPGGSDGTGGY